MLLPTVFLAFLFQDTYSLFPDTALAPGSIIQRQGSTIIAKEYIGLQFTYTNVQDIVGNILRLQQYLPVIRDKVCFQPLVTLLNNFLLEVFNQTTPLSRDSNVHLARPHKAKFFA